MGTPSPIHVKAQNLARRELMRRHRDEYQELYRSNVLQMGGSVRPSKEQRIAALEKQIAELKEEK
jgi:hypothetical protein